MYISNVILVQQYRVFQGANAGITYNAFTSIYTVQCSNPRFEEKDLGLNTLKTEKLSMKMIFLS